MKACFAALLTIFAVLSSNIVVAQEQGALRGVHRQTLFVGESLSFFGQIIQNIGFGDLGQNLENFGDSLTEFRDNSIDFFQDVGVLPPDPTPSPTAPPTSSPTNSPTNSPPPIPPTFAEILFALTVNTSKGLIGLANFFF